jgi:hypothetical protein
MKMYGGMEGMVGFMFWSLATVYFIRARWAQEPVWRLWRTEQSSLPGISTALP